MGGEFGQRREWSHDRSLDWEMVEYPARRSRRAPSRSQTDLSRGERAASSRRGGRRLRWIVVDDADKQRFRLDYQGARATTDRSSWRSTMTPEPRMAYRIGVPQPGFWKESSEHSSPTNNNNNNNNTAPNTAISAARRRAKFRRTGMRNRSNWRFAAARRGHHAARPCRAAGMSDGRCARLHAPRVFHALDPMRGRQNARSGSLRAALDALGYARTRDDMPHHALARENRRRSCPR